MASVDDVNSQNNNNIDNEIAKRLNQLRENQHHGLTSTEEIAQRLQKIKVDMPTTSDAELHSRLARLKGVPDVPQTQVF